MKKNLVEIIYVLSVLLINLALGSENAHKPIEPFDRSQAKAIFAQRKPAIMLLLGDEDESSLVFQILTQNSQKYPHILFTYSKKGQQPYSKLIELVGVTKQSFPVVLYFNAAAEKFLYKIQQHGYYSSQNLANFLSRCDEGQYNVLLRSGQSNQDISEQLKKENKKYMTYFTAYQLQNARRTSQKDLVIMAYTYWCVYSQKFAPVFASIAKKFNNNQNIIFGKIEGAQNQIRGLEPAGYPLILFWGKNKRGLPQIYYGTRQEEDVINWIQEHSNTKLKQQTTTQNQKNNQKAQTQQL